MGIIVYLLIGALIILLNVLAWNSVSFCDLYIENVFPVWVNTYGRVTGLFPFSVGEVLIVAGIVLVVFAVLLGIVLIASLLITRCRAVRYGASCNRMKEHRITGDRTTGDRTTGNRNRKLYRFGKGFYRFFAWTILVVCLIMTLNCFILYHASSFSETYYGEARDDYTPEELITVYNMVASQCNELSLGIERDSSGTVIYMGNQQAAEEAIRLMQKLGEQYPRLQGWYPRPKPLHFSDFMCQQYMQGYYFPFSMEANYNDVMYPLNIPPTMCHELAHLRGYIYEDEANFIGYLACIQSEDAFIRYSGYLSVLNYLSNDLYKMKKNDPDAYEEAVALVKPVAVTEQVKEDNIFVTPEEWDRINGKAVIDTETVTRATDTLVDANLKINGISDGKISYSRVVKLLLQYYCR